MKENAAINNTINNYVSKLIEPALSESVLENIRKLPDIDVGNRIASSILGGVAIFNILGKIAGEKFILGKVEEIE
jgi:hypothetical protein